MSYDRTLARCSFCGRRPADVHRMVAGPGAAYICDDCLQLCNDILHDTAPFSSKALELASRPPIVIAAPQELEQAAQAMPREPQRSVTIELEQKQQGMVLMLHQLQFYEMHFELHYLWIRPPFPVGFAFVPRIIFVIEDNTGAQWMGDRGGMLLARPELMSDARHQAVYQGSARFRPLPSADAHSMIVRAVDPLAQLEEIIPNPWQFEITF
jgi:ClpX C4-type zinc finger